MSLIKGLIIVSFILILAVFFFPSNTLAQNIIFEDNFNDGTSEGWQVIGSPTNWQVVNGEYGILVPSGVTNTVPSDSLWNPDWQNYIYEVDLRGVQGTDKNILIKFKDTANFYEIHHTGGNIHFEKVVNGIGYVVASAVNYPLNNGSTYHFRFEVNNNHYKISESQNLLFDVEDQGPTFQGGKIGLRAGTGAVFPTEVWFDNVIVREIKEGFDLPINYVGRPNSSEEQFQDAFWERLTAAFDHTTQGGIHRPFTGDSYKPRDCKRGILGITCYDGHNGTDFDTDNQEVYSVASGKVAFSSDHDNNSCTPNKGGYGCVVIIEYPSQNAFGLYAHLDKIYVVQDNDVGVSTMIGEIGNTGCPNCGEHLHFGVLKLLSEGGTPLSIQSNEVRKKMSKTDWSELIYSLQPNPEKPPIGSNPQPFCTYKAPNGMRFGFQDPTGWKGGETDPWSLTKKEKGCKIESPYLWKYDVGTSP